MKETFTIIGIGSPIVDAIALVEESFIAQVDGDKGGMVLVDAPTISGLIERLPQAATAAPGGSAGNTLFALARMGAATRFLGKTGNCPQGQFYRDRFAQLGGDSSRFKIGQVPNGRCLSLVTPDGERTMRTDLGAAMTLAPEEISAADFTGCQHAHIEGYLLFNEALMRRVLESAKEAGCSISLDLASFEVVNATKSILPELLKEYVDIIFANEEEASVYTGISDDYPAMAIQLAELCDIAAVKVGAHGSYVAHAGKVDKIEPMHAANVIDTTGAGDLWAAGFLYGWSLQRPLTECAHIGSILGAAVVQEQGSVLPEHIWQDILANI
ncbi:adenosine kinase [Coraliomargarita sp. SDUM461003]|uniref:Adenosine kinase n=1 Tax=Thalassobacterium maritimum TaxID=3041265 RepID=A0ABU1B0D2_9BACT|nr:adenosine kinase [Coraliomargarita sp. SDUM461003]MBT62226.1 adenosine kinase [Puniceicoccaceae bacterium]MDQ8208835.1 adenosine kinase [Coraliomargarita sp. SDUM461003]HBR94157.1 adenosine kinase [Opitutae bacterium]|tara:strand:- start:6170 stop:7150 length:981 start_codon:yes stop_codon:yes gene_type:complete